MTSLTCLAIVPFYLCVNFSRHSKCHFASQLSFFPVVLLRSIVMSSAKKAIFAPYHHSTANWTEMGAVNQAIGAKKLQ